MSNLIFPALPGVKMNVQRTPVYSTTRERAISGREYVAARYLAPLYKYSLSFEFLRSASTFMEFQRLANFLARHSGPYDSFLFDDPEEPDTVDHGFGMGNGSTVAFQLQRTLGVTNQDLLGTWPQYTKPRTNLLVRSQEFDNASWLKTNGGVGSVPVVTPNYGEAPDGTITADLVQFKLGGGVTNTDQSNLSQAIVSQVGRQYAFALWVKTADGTTKTMLLEAASGAGGLVTITGTWQRFTAAWTAGSTFGNPFLRLRGGTSQTSDTADVLVWGGQLEPDAVIASQYIPTVASSVTQAPAFWPGFADGFEPVYELGPGLSLFRTDWQGRRQLLPYARTNLTVQSEAFDISPWVTGAATVVPNGLTSPDGNLTADFIRENASTAEHKVYQQFAAPDNARVTQSVWMKAGRQQGYLFFQTKATTFPGAMFDLLNGTVTAQNNGGVGAITAYPDGWYRCECSCSIASGGAQPVAEVLIVGPASATSYLGDGSSGLWVFGHHLEIKAIGTAATPYIKTTTAAVTLTDYTLNSKGLVTLAAPPLAGAGLSWSGTYFRRCRVDTDEVRADRIFNLIWETRQLDLISAMP